MNITDSQVETLLLQKVYTNSEYLTLLVEHYDKRFFENQSIIHLLQILMTYYQTYHKMPGESTVSLIVDKYCQGKELDANRIMIEFRNALKCNLTEDEQFMKDQVIEFIRNKSMYWAIMDNLENIEKHKDVGVCIDKFKKVSCIGFDEGMGFDYFRDLDKHFNEVANPESIISTGYSQMDAAMNGGITKHGSMTIFMAEPGLGKSLFMGNLAVNFMKQGLFPVIISLEMPELMYGKRIDAHISLENINALQYNIDKAKSKIREFHKLHENARLLIKEFPPSTISTNHIQQYLEKVTAVGRKPDVIIIDYLNLLLPNFRSKTQNMYERVGDICKDVRALSYKFRAPVISATQANKGGWNTADVELENVSESAGTAATADFLGALYQQEGDREASRLNMKILKSRFGMLGQRLEFYIDYKSLRVLDMFKKEEQSDVVETAIKEIETL